MSNQEYCTSIVTPPTDRAALLLRCLSERDTHALEDWGREDLIPGFRRTRRALYYQYLGDLRREWTLRLRAQLQRDDVTFGEALRAQHTFHWHLGALYLAGVRHALSLPTSSYVGRHVSGTFSALALRSA